MGDLNAKPEKFEAKRNEIDSAIPTTPCLERDYLDSSSLASPGFQYMGGGGICLLISFFFSPCNILTSLSTLLLEIDYFVSRIGCKADRHRGMVSWRAALGWTVETVFFPSIRAGFVCFNFHPWKILSFVCFGVMRSKFVV